MSDHLDRLEAEIRAGTRPLDIHSIEAVARECRRLRTDVAALEGILSDVREDGPFAAGEQHGAARQLAECMAYLEGEFLPTSSCRSVVNGCRALGPVRPPLPAERESAGLRKALAGLVAAIDGEKPYDREAAVAIARAVAREALGLPPRSRAAPAQ